MKNILIPLDGSVYSVRALEKGKEIAKVYDSNLILINVVDNLIPTLNVADAKMIMDNMKASSKKLLEKSKKSLGDDFKVQLISLDGDIATTIVDFAEKNYVDLIIMGSQGLGEGRIMKFFIGSKTQRVLSTTKIPVLVVK